MKWPWNCISWNALKEKFHSVSFPLRNLLVNLLVKQKKSTCIVGNVVILQIICYQTLSVSSLPQHKKIHQLMTFMGSIYDAKLMMYGSSHPEVLCKIDVLRHFTKFSRKNLCRSAFRDKVASLHPVALLNKTLRHRCF